MRLPPILSYVGVALMVSGLALCVAIALGWL